MASHQCRAVVGMTNVLMFKLAEQTCLGLPENANKIKIMFLHTQVSVWKEVSCLKFQSVQVK